MEGQGPRRLRRVKSKAITYDRPNVSELEKRRKKNKEARKSRKKNRK